VLYARAIERLQLSEEDTLVDLYCGVGGFALQAASKAGFVVGVEELDGAVLRARNAARFNRLNAEFHSGKVEEVLPDLEKRLRGVGPIVTVNPARRGLEPGVIDQIMALQPKRVAYISCHPRTLARDLRAFRDAGMEIGDLEMFDMFPNTPHVECLVTMEAPETGGARRRAPRRKVVR
jgi:23S rRNA (uracil1939-C5)-methyltransferase